MVMISTAQVAFSNVALGVHIAAAFFLTVLWKVVLVE